MVPCKNRHLRFVALLLKVSERSVTHACPHCSLLPNADEKKTADRKFPLLPGASHAPRPGGLGQLHQRCHAPAILGLRGLPEVNPHTLSLADLHFMCIPGLRSEARLANLVFSLVSTDLFFVSTFSELGAKCFLSHAASRPTDLETNPWIGGVKFVQKNLLCKWF